jgi:prepilin-type N-terminal cleavage/methylation domain-containing protein
MYRSKYLRESLPQKNTHLDKIKGFSLIELMVVMAIMAVLLALTGGLATNNISKRDRLVEIEKVAQIFKRLSYQAYYTGYDIEVRLEGDLLTTRTAEQTTNIEFKQLTFVGADFLISTKAFISPSVYRVSWQDDYRDFPITSMFKRHEN